VYVTAESICWRRDGREKNESQDGELEIEFESRRDLAIGI